MSKARNITNDRNSRPTAAAFSSSDFEPVSSFGFRISDFRARRGFSFAEVLFAVAVLGIGFIMIAAVFPAAILQTQAAMDETVGTTLARNGSAAIGMSRLMNRTQLPDSAGLVFWFRDPRISGTPSDLELWNSVRRDLIASDDPRFAIVPMYSRTGTGTFAKVIVVSVRIRQQDQFKLGVDDERAAASVVANLEPRPVKVRLIDGGAGGVDYIQIANIAPADDGTLAPFSNTSNAFQAAVTDAIVIISNDRVAEDTSTIENESGRLNGRVYRLGVESDNPPPPATPPPAGWRQFELAIGADMASNLENIPGATTGSEDGIALLIGAGYADPLNPPEHGQQSQAIQVYQTIVPLR